FARLAIRLAAMIDPARIVAIVAAIDHLAIFQAEEEGVKRILRIRPGALGGLTRTDTLARIFNQAGFRLDFARGEYPAAMDLGISYSEWRFLLGRVGLIFFHRVQGMMSWPVGRQAH